MPEDLSKWFYKQHKHINNKEIADILKTTPDALKAFENIYQTYQEMEPDETNLFKVSSRDAAAARKKYLGSPDFGDEGFTELSKRISEKIVDELVAQTSVYSYDPNAGAKITKATNLLPEKESQVTKKDIEGLPMAFRPQLTGSLLAKDFDKNSYEDVLYFYKKMIDETDPKKKQKFYGMFRQGLDILDLDPILYEIIGMNKNSIGHWFPQLVDAYESANDTFFKIPATKIAKVPLPILQLTRLDYHTLTYATTNIVDKWASKVFETNPNKEYFVKTGIYSSKFNFQNAHIDTPSNVNDIGQFLLYIHHQSVMMASPLSHPVTYGVATTNEWVVRDFIPCKSHNLTIYKGLPLRTEYRVFIDCDRKKTLAIHPYWDEDMMTKRFAENRDITDKHDAVIFEAQRNKLNTEYNKNKDAVLAHADKIAKAINLSGQWSMDIMQEGNDFYIIDMALAQNSAFYDSIPAELRNPSEEKWIPEISE